MGGWEGNLYSSKYKKVLDEQLDILGIAVSPQPHINGVPESAQTEASPNASIIPLKTSFWKNVISGKAHVGKHKHSK